MEWQIGDYAQVTSFPNTAPALNYYQAHLHDIFQIDLVEDTYVRSTKHGYMSKRFLTNVTKQELIKRFNQFVIL